MLFPHQSLYDSAVSTQTFIFGKDHIHRLRIINVGAFAEFQMQIDGHYFAVTEVDGTNVEPLYYHWLEISPGQRYCIPLSANIEIAESFWMRARMVTACFAEENQ